MNPLVLNRLHDLRSLAKDLRHQVEMERGWQVAVHLATAETELTEAIAFVNECDEARAAKAFQLWECVGCGNVAGHCCNPCPVCGSRMVQK